MKIWVLALLVWTAVASVSAQPLAPPSQESRAIRLLRAREAQILQVMRDEPSRREHYADLELIFRQQNEVRLADMIRDYRALRFPLSRKREPLKPAPAGRVEAPPPASRSLLRYRVELKHRAEVREAKALKELERELRGKVSEPGAEAEWTYLLAMCFAYQNQPGVACALFYRSFNEEPGQADIVVGFLRALHRSGADGLAGELVDNYRVLMESESDFHAIAAEIFWEMGRYRESLVEAAAWTVQDPGNPNAWYAEGEKLFRRTKYADARTRFARALSLDGKHLLSLAHMARLSARNGDAEDTVQWLKRYRSLVSPEEFVALLNRSEFLNVPRVLLLLD